MRRITMFDSVLADWIPLSGAKPLTVIVTSRPGVPVFVGPSTEKAPRETERSSLWRGRSTFAAASRIVAVECSIWSTRRKLVGRGRIGGAPPGDKGRPGEELHGPR